LWAFGSWTVPSASAKVPEPLTPLIEKFEGFHKVVRWKPVPLAVPYICPAGYWTIGFGVLCQRDHPPVTLEQGKAMLAEILPSYVSHALRLSPVLLGDERRLAAIGSFIFNLGPTRYAASTLRRRVNERAWGQARGELQRWVYGGGKRLGGLVLRREAEAALL
jgi:lysozyme